jgi:hypothetical protein
LPPQTPPGEWTLDCASFVHVEAHVVMAGAAAAVAQDCSFRVSTNLMFWPTSVPTVVKEGSSKEHWITRFAPTSFRVVLWIEIPPAEDCCYVFVQCSCPPVMGSGLQDHLVGEASVFYAVSDAIRNAAVAASLRSADDPDFNVADTHPRGGGGGGGVHRGTTSYVGARYLPARREREANLPRRADK